MALFAYSTDGTTVIRTRGVLPKNLQRKLTDGTWRQIDPADPDLADFGWYPVTEVPDPGDSHLTITHDGSGFTQTWTFDQALQDARVRAELTPQIDDLNATVGILVEDAFKHQYQGEYLAGQLGALVTALVNAGALDATTGASVAPDQAQLDAIHASVRDQIQALDADPVAREAMVVDRLQKARGLK